MKVLVTGATGFLGAHTVAELCRSGHSVRLLARAQRRVPAALEPLGVEGTETILGDITEPTSVERALQGCDSVVHCGSIYSLDPRAAPPDQEDQRHRNYVGPGKGPPARVGSDRSCFQLRGSTLDWYSGGHLDARLSCYEAAGCVFSLQGGLRSGSSKLPGIRSLGKIPWSSPTPAPSGDPTTPILGKALK